MINAESGLMHSEDGGRDLQARKYTWPLSKKKKKKANKKTSKILRKILQSLQNCTKLNL